MGLGLVDQLQIFWQLYLRIARGFNRFGATRTVTFDISKSFDRVWHVGLLHKLKSYGISIQIFGLISSSLSNRRFWVVLDGKSSQEYPVNAGLNEVSILGPALLLYINDLPDDVICNIAIYADDTTLYSKFDLNLNLIYDTLSTGEGSGLLVSMLEKFSWFHLTGVMTLVLLMWEWTGLFLRKNHLLKCWGWLSLLNWIGAPALSLLSPSKKIGALIRFLKFLSIFSKFP